MTEFIVFLLVCVFLIGFPVWLYIQHYNRCDTLFNLRQRIVYAAAFAEVTDGLRYSEIYTKKNTLRVAISKKVDQKIPLFDAYAHEEGYSQMLSEKGLLDEGLIYCRMQGNCVRVLRQYAHQRIAEKPDWEQWDSKSSISKHQAEEPIHKKSDLKPNVPEKSASQTKTVEKPSDQTAKTDEHSKNNVPIKSDYRPVHVDRSETDHGITPEAFFEWRKNRPFPVPGVYIIYNEDKDQYYVGQAVKLSDRIRQHFTGHGNQDVYADYKYGHSFRIQWLFLEESEFSDLNAMERYYISFYDAYEHGYNRTAGNTSPYKARLKRGEFKDVKDAADFLSNAVTHCAQEMGIPEHIIIQVLDKTFQTNVSPECRSDLIVRMLNRILEKQHAA